MHQTHNLNQRMRLFISIFLPILIYQLANFSASFVDTTMTGQYDTLHLAGVSMATSLLDSIFRPADRDCFGLGTHNRASFRAGEKRKDCF